MLVSPDMVPEVLKREPEPYCNCWSKRSTVPWQQLDACGCGEVSTECEWTWDKPAITGTSWLVLSEDKRQVTFHPFYSSGTAVVKGDTPFELNNHYYWEVKVLTETYGTDIIVGVGTNKMDITSAQFNFTSLLGNSDESYGLSYTGCLRHNDMELPNAGGFCRGTIIGVRVDMWRGTLEYYLNRKPQGICFYNLRRHSRLYPMISSTAAQSSMRLVYAGSWRGSLLVDALRTLAAGVRAAARDLPPGLRYLSTSKFWLTLPSNGHRNIDEEMEQPKETLKSCYSMEELPSEYINGYYVDGVQPNYRIVVYEVR